MNNGELKQAIMDYSHRPDVAPQLDIMLEMAANRIGRHLKSNENQDSHQVAMVSEANGELPDDFEDVLSITHGGTTLQRVTYERVQQYQQSGGDVEVYSIGAVRAAKRLIFGAEPGLVDPSGIWLNYWWRPAAMTGDTDTNSLLDRFPQLYLYAGLVEVFAFTQDTDPRQAALDTFLTEVDEINIRATSGRWGSGTMQGI